MIVLTMRNETHNVEIVRVSYQCSPPPPTPSIWAPYSGPITRTNLFEPTGCTQPPPWERGAGEMVIQCFHAPWIWGHEGRDLVFRVHCTRLALRRQHSCTCDLPTKYARTRVYCKLHPHFIYRLPFACWLVCVQHAYRAIASLQTAIDGISMTSIVLYVTFITFLLYYAMCSSPVHH